ncbi:hypothetical protein [Amycolatopsis alkalitolerans]|uniref:Uncharacterized protein n=1 Tax=Amycolatopsis alkalitolerans TaxID=2547244 RepID=A0A5C4LVQ4_9PSEU|nr:hypothetical protein [Amycolatopsis alkalitolerans]TNC22360.1 hypothetical protein FG385_25500 [Amycolatopsis alkalitolerans]
MTSLPPPRELPPEVRARLRENVLAGIERPSRRGWLVAAAAVLLVAGGVTGVQLLRTGPDSSTLGTASGPVDRCWAAARAAGKAGQLPDRKNWRTVSTASQGDDVVTGFSAGGKTMFCETTATTVTLSDPDAKVSYAKGTRTALLLYTGTGLAAGIADPSWHGIELSMPDGLGITSALFETKSREFALFTGTDPAKTMLWAGDTIKGQRTRPGPRVQLPAPPPPLFTVVDRPGDRGSREGHALGACLAALPAPLAGADGYQPGALLEDGGYQVVLGRNAGHAIACVTEPGRPHTVLYVDTYIGESIPVRRLSVPQVGSKVPFVGITPQSATTMKADFGLAEPQYPTVLNGTFAMWLPPGARPVDPARGETSVQVDDARGASLFNGYVPMR